MPTPKKLTHIIWLCSLCAILLIGCTNATVEENNNDADLTIIAPVSTVTITEISTRLSKSSTVNPISLTDTPTPAILATELLTVTLTSTSTSLPILFFTEEPPTTSTPTITPLPTLSVEDEGDLLSSLMADNGGCMLPCWWGITPGQTTVQEGRDHFASQGIDNWVVTFDGKEASLGLGYPRIDNSNRAIDVLLRLELNNNLIQLINIGGGYGYGDFRNKFIQDWQQYGVSEILMRLGPPTHVRFLPIGNSPYHLLGIAYEHLGVEIYYTILPKTMEDGSKSICSNFEQIDFINLVLYPPEQSETIRGIMPNLETYEQESWPVTTGLDLDAFYDLFKEPMACIEVE